jgi:ArsR family transcriptional regulator
VGTSTFVASTPGELVAQLSALADPVRLRIVGLLSRGSQCVCDLHERVPVAANLLSYHLRVLREAGLVVATRRGRWVHYRLDGDGIGELWARLAAAGVPIPGEPMPEDGVADGRRGVAHEDKEM